MTRMPSAITFSNRQRWLMGVVFSFLLLPLRFDPSLLSVAHGVPRIASGNNQVTGLCQQISQPLVVQLDATAAPGTKVRATIIEGPGLPPPDAPPPPEGSPPLMVPGILTLAEPDGTCLGDLRVGCQAEPAVLEIESDPDAQGQAKFCLRPQIGSGQIVTSVGEFTVGQPTGTESTGKQAEETVAFNTFVWTGPDALAAEADGNFLVLDSFLGTVIRLNPTARELTVISGPDVGTGPPISTGTSIAVEAPGFALVPMVRGLMRVELATGNRSVVSGCPNPNCSEEERIGSGLLFQLPGGIIVDASGSAFVTDRLNPYLIRVELATGNRSIASGCLSPGPTCIGEPDDVGDGPPLSTPRSIAFAEELGSGLVLDSESIFDVTLATGDRSIIAGCGGFVDPAFPCSAPPVEDFGGIAVEGPFMGGPFPSVLVAGSSVKRFNPSLLSLDLYEEELVSGCSSAPADDGCSPDDPSCCLPDDPSCCLPGDPFCLLGISSEICRGSGPEFISLRAIAVHQMSRTVLVTDEISRTVMQVNPDSGDRDILADVPSVGEGPAIIAPFGIAVEQPGSVLVTNAAFALVSATERLPSVPNLIRVNTATGDRSLVSGCPAGIDGDCVGAGPTFSSPILMTDGAVSVVLNGMDSGLVATGDQIVRVDLTTGNRSVVSGDDGAMGVGEGPRFEQISDIALETERGAVVANAGVVDPEAQSLLRVDLTTGDRSLVSGRICDLITLVCNEEAGVGPSFMNAIQSIAMETPNAALVAAPGVIYRVDLSTGNRSIVSGCNLNRDNLDCVEPSEPIGQGPRFIDVGDMVMADANSLLIVNRGDTHTLTNSVLRVDLNTGDRQLISGCPDSVRTACGEAQARGSGPPILDGRGIVLEDAESALVMAHAFRAVMRVDLNTGDRVFVSRSTQNNR